VIPEFGSIKQRLQTRSHNCTALQDHATNRLHINQVTVLTSLVAFSAAPAMSPEDTGEISTSEFMYGVGVACKFGLGRHFHPIACPTRMQAVVFIQCWWHLAAGLDSTAAPKACTGLVAKQLGCACPILAPIASWRIVPLPPSFPTRSSLPASQQRTYSRLSA
jgi:hypothetical protein